MNVVDSRGNDHEKEYFFKISAKGRKMYYKRTECGFKVIAKDKIPNDYIIREYDPNKDFDWLRQKKCSDMKLLKTKKQLEKPDLTPRSIEILNDRIARYELSMVFNEACDVRDAEIRYKEELRAYSGFNNYFKHKYRNYYDKYKDYTVFNEVENYETLIELKIINVNISFKEVKRNYRRWLVANHPDKGGSPEKFKMVTQPFLL